MDEWSMHIDSDGCRALGSTLEGGVITSQRRLVLYSKCKKETQELGFSVANLPLCVPCSGEAMGAVRITSWYPNFNGSHFACHPALCTK